MTTPFQPVTVIEPWKFEAITQSQFITFTMINPLNHRQLLPALVLRLAVLDSPTAKADDDSPIIVAMIVPKNRETDWNFCTKSGHIQLLLRSHNISRLILIGNNPPRNPGLAIYKRPPTTDTLEEQRLVNELKPLLMSLHPKMSFNRGLPETLFFTYKDDLAYRVTVAKVKGHIVGEFLVEDVELVGGSDRNKELRRRLRFKRMPTLIQSQALLVPLIDYNEATTQTDLESLMKMEGAKFEVDTRVLVQQYVIHMVAGLFLIVSHLKERYEQGFFPRALCLGIGGGVLLSFLNTQMGLHVTGVESDVSVLIAATEHFGFNKSLAIRVIVADAMEVIQNFLPLNPGGKMDDKFDVIMVDLDSSDAKNGFCAPPPEFVKKSVFEDLRSLLDDHGALIINVVPLNELFFTTLVKELGEIFHNVYKIDTGNQENFVVIAIFSPSSSGDDDDDNNNNIFLERLKSTIPGTYPFVTFHPLKGDVHDMNIPNIIFL
ncbi:hypothetical protein Lser_V15G08216 [Lactuca serriola]